MFAGGKRFAPAMLCFLEPKREAADFVQSGYTHNCVNEPTVYSGFTEGRGNQVESEKTYQAPIEGTNEKKGCYDNI